MDVKLPDGTIVQNVPEGITQSELMSRLQRSNTASQGPFVGGEKPAPMQVEQPKSMADYAKAAYEIPLSVGSSLVAQPVSNIYGALKALTSPQAGTQAGVNIGRQAAANLASQMTYKPESPVSQDVLNSLGSGFEAAKLPPYIGGGTAGQLSQAAQLLKPSVSILGKGLQAEMGTDYSKLANALRKEPVSTMSGVGAAEVPEAVNRVSMAEQLRVPIKLSKGQATRDLGQQQFEIETAKNYPESVGKPLIQAQAQRNENILQNFDAFVDATGKEAYGLRATGKIVDDALVNASRKAKKQIDDSYEIARQAGETAELVDVRPVQKFLSGLEAESINAPIIKSAEVKLNSLAKDGKLSINDLEEIRKMVNRLSSDTKSNMEYGNQIKQQIDAITENVGGQLYKDARALRAKYAREFENVGAVDKLLSKKPGTSDRSVALEDVFSHSILNGSLDDVRNIGRTLKKAGPEGEQAWKELQGQTIEHIKDQVTKSIDVDSFGNPVVSPAKFKAVVKELDQDGKLDYLFGKKGAQEVRDLLETTIAVNAPLKGAANYSNTSSAIIRALDRIGGTPLGKLPGFGAVSEYATKKAAQKQVEESLNFNPSDIAKELRKGK